ncbi:MAG: hypothetical protein FD127_99 [Acidimicrobiaceae bacterium]|jgi:hypothetical protein|nr:MAG: hypothetical protein FD127_99 [Acidimicrobiaceae bacterium]
MAITASVVRSSRSTPTTRRRSSNQTGDDAVVTSRPTPPDAATTHTEPDWVNAKVVPSGDQTAPLSSQ